MRDTKVTVAALRSVLRDPAINLALVRSAAEQAQADGARMLFAPELMLTGHGAHPSMADNAEPVPEGPLAQAVLGMSAELGIAICVGIAELDPSDLQIYNSQFVVDRGEYLGLQRKVNPSGDEYVYFGCGDDVPVFDIGDLRFGITICYDSAFPELGLMHSLNQCDLILCPHAARSGEWEDPPSPDFCQKIIGQRQHNFERTQRGRANDNNAYVLCCNAVGSSTDGLSDVAATNNSSGSGKVVANHAGTVFGVEPSGTVFLRTSATTLSDDEIVTVELKAEKRAVNFTPARNRRLRDVVAMLQARL